MLFRLPAMRRPRWGSPSTSLPPWSLRRGIGLTTIGGSLGVLERWRIVGTDIERTVVDERYVEYPRIDPACEGELRSATATPWRWPGAIARDGGRGPRPRAARAGTRAPVGLLKFDLAPRSGRSLEPGPGAHGRANRSSCGLATATATTRAGSSRSSTTSTVAPVICTSSTRRRWAASAGGGHPPARAHAPPEPRGVGPGRSLPLTTRCAMFLIGGALRADSRAVRRDRSCSAWHHLQPSETDPGPTSCRRRTESLVSSVTQHHRAISAHQSQLLAAVVELDRRKAWRVDGATSMVAWLVQRCGVTAATARDWVTAAAKLHALPKISDALSQGKLSFDQVKPLVEVATARDRRNVGRASDPVVGQTGPGTRDRRTERIGRAGDRLLHEALSPFRRSPAQPDRSAPARSVRRGEELTHRAGPAAVCGIGRRSISGWRMPWWPCARATLAAGTGRLRPKAGPAACVATGPRSSSTPT